MKTYKLSVLIPCYNEISTIEEILNRVRNAEPINKEVIIIDDVSTDGTLEKLKSLEKLYDKLIIRSTNGGKGAAIKDGLKAATGDIIIFQDADLEYDPKEYKKILSPIIKGHAEVVYGSRFIIEDEYRILHFWHKFANNIFSKISNMFSNLSFTDMHTCYKCFKAEIIKNMTLNENRFGLDTEITAKISRLNISVYEVAISYKGRTYSEGKKIGYKDAFRSLYCIFKYNLFKF